MDDTKTKRPPSSSNSERPLLMTENEAAQLLGFSPRTLQKWRIEGRGPHFVKCGRSVRYRWEDLLGWMQENIRRSTSDPGGSEED